MDTCISDSFMGQEPHNQNRLCDPDPREEEQGSDQLSAGELSPRLPSSVS